ncbi:sugar phosphate isomerase/epimerase family protein [Fructilactobacillus fructivorans]|uniref:Sugar phosphate isomerase/epimerase n=1 Tax=Fructilactobacillus fructivorans TaxID=1614 RepID=A0AAE6P0P6_9LACO|nr:sugar phosphate isomerase/epimerase [Fructilactobacillus fructivorans]KRK58185.1 sugar phosphatase isomerase epimerase [Fructilactobacillus fructivorans]QFX92177.1 sugar phosphate isomerase/epimerase [Fructilactobacillus fructivorans]RDV65225.1 sugar phosphate isomerase/epimerase [Fructilactobacillus fructivorans]
MKLFLNTWIFVNDIDAGTRQSELFARVKDTGADGIEVRREYIKDFPKELDDIHQASRKTGLLVNYSVPDELFLKDGSINPKLKQYFDEGQRMGITKIKFNVGNFRKFDGDLAHAFDGLPLDQIQLNVENDQTEVSGKIANIKHFLNQAKKNDLPIKYVYDLGNWAFTHQSADYAADCLGSYTDYIHLKNVNQFDEDDLQTADDLNDGMFDWKNILRELPPKTDLALEFPMQDDEHVKRQVQLLKDEVM